MAHGANNSSLFTGMPAEVERGIIAGVLRTIEDKTGKRPRGWLGPALTETDNTLDILAEAGIQYVADWCNDELPYEMRTKHGAIVAMPYTLEIGDIPVFLTHGGTGEDFYRIAVDQFETLYAEGARSAEAHQAIQRRVADHRWRAARLLPRAAAGQELAQRRQLTPVPAR
jgi:peptidoglycan/xylan/chitin deacetylase (PgdA/CDA1 family)